MLDQGRNRVSRRPLPRVSAGVVIPDPVQQALNRRPPITVLRAPRGFGKTTVVAAWVRQQSGQLDEYCWVSLPHKPIERPELWAAIHLGLTGQEVAATDEAWNQLVLALTALERPTAVVLDQFDRIADHRVDDEVMDLLSRFDRLRLLVILRTERPIETLAETWPDGVVLGMGDLALIGPQVRVLAEHLGTELSDEEAAGLATDLSGWPALIRGVLRGSHRDAQGTFRPEWLSVEKFCLLVLADSDVEPYYPLLVALTAPQEFTMDLAVALLGPDLLRGVFGRLLRAGLVQECDDGDTPTFTFRPRLRAAIQNIVRVRDRDRYLDVHRRLGQWFQAEDMPEWALDHAVEGEDWATATTLAETYWLEMASGCPVQASHALRKIPDELVRGSARLLVVRDYIVNGDAQMRAAEAFRQARMDVDFAAGHQDQQLSLGQVLGLRDGGLGAVGGGLSTSPSGSAARSTAWADDALAEMPELLLQWSITQLLTADLVGAAYAFREAYRWARERQMVGAAREAASGVALCLVMLGHLAAAGRWRALAAEGPASEPDAALGRLAGHVVAEVLDIDRLEFRRRPSDEDVQAIRGLPGVESIEHHLDASRALHEPERRIGALSVLEKSLADLDPDGHGARLANAAVLAAAVDLCVATEQFGRARQLLSDSPPGPGWASAAHARIALFDGEWSRVMDLTRRVERFAATEIRHATHLALMRACAANRLGLADRAGDCLQLAISLAEQTGSVRPFTMVPRADLDEILEQFPHVSTTELFEQVRAVPEVFGAPREPIQLSVREVAVLEEIATGQSLPSAARRLYVTENTIKSQVRNIYRKLGVHTREDAIERATALRLLADD